MRHALDTPLPDTPPRITPIASRDLRPLGVAPLPAVMVGIVLVDFALGARAEYLNAYEIVRRTFGLPLPATAETYVLGQEAAGRFSLAWAWALWIAEAAIVAGAFSGLASACRWIAGRRSEKLS